MRKAGRGSRSREDREPARHRACAGEPPGRGTGVGDRRGDPLATAARSCGRAVQVLIAIASIEVAATLLLLPWAWGDYYREHGELAVFLTTKLVGHAAAAGLLLWAGRGDWRTWLLGVYSLLKATHAPTAHAPGLCSGGAAAAGVRGLSPAPARPQPALCLPSAFPRSCSRRPSCGRSLASARGSIAGPGSMIWRAA